MLLLLLLLVRYLYLILELKYGVLDTTCMATLVRHVSINDKYRRIEDIAENYRFWQLLTRIEKMTG